MNKRITARLIIAAAYSLLLTNAFAQKLTWYDPVKNDFAVIEGQGWPKEVAAPYDRFPARAEKTVNPNVWNISHSSAGLYIKFKTNANAISIRYVIKGMQSMTHMPATGVSGIDLYALDPNGKWIWAPGHHTMGDTCEYHFTGLVISTEFPNRDYEYRLYLPLYTAVSWLSIGVAPNSSFSFMPLSAEKPIVVYGTSIAQGACASRPGMAWSNLLQQRLDRPLINLGFSGSGKLEQPVIDLMAEIDARLYMLDCLPNLTMYAGCTPQELESRILAAVKKLKEKRPQTPILLSEHSSGGNSMIADTGAWHDADNASRVLQTTFDKMKAAGITGIYLLSNTSMELSMNTTVDGVHFNDAGMVEYACANEKMVRFILAEPAASLSTTTPVVQSRDGYYNWRNRHQEIITGNKTKASHIVFFGNSIIHYWGGLPAAPLSRGAGSWNRYLAPAGVGNFAFGWDRIENILWRVYHDELDGFRAEQVWIMAGTNNLGINSDSEIIAGLKQLVTAVTIRQPKARIVLYGLLPRRAMEQRVAALNARIAMLAGYLKVSFGNPGTVLLDKNKKINELLFEDGLHPNATGYDKLVLTIKSFLKY
jgi:lysophospholipase L1-like esterase